MTVPIQAQEISMVNIEHIVPNPKNPNQHTDDQIDRLVSLIEYQGFRNPLIVSKRSGFLVVGHGRLMAAKKLGLTQVPVIHQEFKDEAQEYAYVVSDNAIAEWSSLDLSAINTEMLDFGPEFDIDMLGIADFSIEPIEKFDPACDEDEIPEEIHPVVVQGDLWLLGEHRLMCKDSTSIDDVQSLMDGKMADMIFTDPPYGVSYEGGHNKKKRSGIQNDTLEGESITDLFLNSLSCAQMVSHDHAAFYIWYADKKSVETYASFSQLDLEIRAVICWYKVNSGLGAFMAQYIPNYEPCIYAHKSGCSPKWNGPSNEKTVWEQKRVGKNEFHPTQKPVELPERAILNSSDPKDIVLDLFGGSGSTLIACQKTGRTSFTMEIDPAYCDVIISRWQKYTGKKAVLASTNQTFDELKEAKHGQA